MFRSFGFDEFLLLLAACAGPWRSPPSPSPAAARSASPSLVMRIAKLRALRWLATGWIQAVQGTPLLGHLFVIFFGLPLVGFDVSRWVAATVALSVYGSAFLAEIWRGAVDAIPSGNGRRPPRSACRLSPQLRLVILPQALTIAIPPTVGFLVQLVKNTSLASIIGLVELSRRAQLVNGATFAPFTVYGVTAVLYFCLCFPLTRWSRVLERARAGSGKGLS